MKKLIIMLIALVATMNLSAQTAMKVLDKASSEFKKSASVNVSFEVGVDGQTDKGTVVLQGKKFCTSLSSTTIWFDGKTMWTYVKDNEEVNVTTPSTAQLAKINPYAFLDIYKKGYNVAFGGNTKAYYEVILTATDKKTAMQKAIVRIDKKDYHPTYIMMGQARGNLEISITSYKTGKKLADSAFQFNKKKYPKAEVIDLR